MCNASILRQGLVFASSALVIWLGSCAPGNIRPAVAETSPQKSGARQALTDVGVGYGFPAPTEIGNNITFKSRYTTIVFETNSRKLLFNGLLVWMNGPVVKEGGEWTLTSADITKVIYPLLRSDKTMAGVRFSTVVIDPGHGGDDPGAIGRRKVYEKKVVLDIARRVREKLRGSGLSVKLTREEDSALSLAARAAKAKEWKADIFVSIHCNSAHNTKAAGLETYVIPAAGFPSTAGNNDRNTYSGNKYDRANTLLAYYVHKETLARTKSVDRGIRRARFDVIRDAPCPAILVECGFISNKAEEEKMLQRKYRNNIAEGVARGILTYVKRAESSRFFHYSVQTGICAF